MKFKKDVALALATVAGALVALFAIFVTIPVWFEAVVITLTVVGGAMAVTEIVKAYKASYDEVTEKHSYKFPVRVFVLGTLLLVAVAAIVLLSLKRLFGFALIPVAVLLAILLVIAFLKKLRIMKWIVGLLLAILVVALIGYYTSAIVHSGVNLNPGISTETTAPETDVPETNAPETNAPETNAPETNAPETNNPADDQTAVHLKVYMPKAYNFGETVKVEVTGINAHELEFEYKDVVSVKAVSDTELTIAVYDDINKVGKIDYTVNDDGHYVITDSAANRVYTIEIVDPDVNDPVIENDKDTVENKPVEEVEKPEVETKPTVPEKEETKVETKPVAPETKPEDTYTPVVVKINAPETMSYAEPIRITVEGINANDLKFGNEDFLSIVVISDTEVEVTLIGIVNDAGEVEFIPAAGYITVTDSVSGINTTIEIVE